MILLVEELRNSSSGAVDVHHDGQGGFTLSCGGTEVLRAEWAEGPSRLVATIELGRVAPSRKILAYEAMLTYNLLWRETGGARMAMAGPDGEVVLVHEWAAEQATACDLSAMLARLFQVGGAWRRFVIEAPAPEAPTHEMAQLRGGTPSVKA